MKKRIGILVSMVCVLFAASCSDTNAQSTNTAATVSTSAETSESIATSTDVNEDATTTTTTATTTTTTTAATTTTTTTAATTTTTVTTEEPFVVETVTIAGNQYQTDVLELDLSWKTLSDQDIENLAKCKKLVSLNMEWGYVSTDGDDYYSAMSSIDQKFSFLSELKDLKKLAIPYGVTFKNITDLTQLEYLGITSAEMTMSNLNLNDLRKLENLRELDLGGLNMFNPDISVLKKMKNLETLIFYDAYFNPYEGEEQIDVLCSLKSLKKLYIGDMSAENIQKIQQALPDCVIARDNY